MNDGGNLKKISLGQLLAPSKAVVNVNDSVKDNDAGVVLTNIVLCLLLQDLSSTNSFCAFLM